MSDALLEHRLAAAQRWIEVGRPQDALQALAGAPPLGEHALEVHRLRGFALLALEQPDAALQEAWAGLAEDPTDLQLLVLVSIAQDLRGDLADAERAILAALGLAPDRPELLCQYAHLCAGAGQFEKADRLLDAAAAMDPESADVLHERTTLAWLRGDKKAARRLAEEALRRNPESERGHRMLGALDLQAGRAGAAQERFAALVRADPTDAGTAKAARAAKVMRSPLYWPLALLGRLGVAGSWLLAMVTIFGLRGAGFETAALVATVAWLVLCVYSWVAGPVIRRRIG